MSVGSLGGLDSAGAHGLGRHRGADRRIGGRPEADRVDHGVRGPAPGGSGRLTAERADGVGDYLSVALSIF